eukprot:gene166-221_t
MQQPTWTLPNMADQSGKVVLITGATSGIGKEAVKQLVAKNASVIMGIRNLQKAHLVRQDILAQFPKADIRIKYLDLGSLSTIYQLADDMVKEDEQLDILINNAGVMMCPYAMTIDGFEMQMGTNHLGPFALTGLLLPLLKKSKGARIVVTSSVIHRLGKLDLKDLNWEKRTYNKVQAYADSKLANLYFAYLLAERLKAAPDFPTVTAAHPGWTNTDLARSSEGMRLLKCFAQKVEKGALSTLRAATDENAQSGDYYGPSQFLELQGPPIKVKSSERSHDKAIAEQLWKKHANKAGYLVKRYGLRYILVLGNISLLTNA